MNLNLTWAQLQISHSFVTQSLQDDGAWYFACYVSLLSPRKFSRTWTSEDDDKDKDLKICPQGSSRTRTFLKNNNTGTQRIIHFEIDISIPKVSKGVRRECIRPAHGIMWLRCVFFWTLTWIRTHFKSTIIECIHKVELVRRHSWIPSKKLFPLRTQTCL